MSFADRIRETVTFTGTKGATATITLPGSASTGYDPFSRRYTNGTANIPVVIAHRTADEWQACLCTFNAGPPNTLTVNSIVTTSDAADAAVNFSNGDKDIYVSGLSTSFLPPLTSGQFVVGNASNVPTAVAPEVAASRIGIFDCVKAFSNQIDVESTTIDSTIDHIRTAGYYQAGDGGGALYKRIATPSPVKAWHITSSGSVYWELVSLGEVNVRQLGAKGDDTTDDYAAIQGAIDYAGFTGIGSEVVIPWGIYRVGTPLVCQYDTSNHTVAGSSPASFYQLGGVRDAVTYNPPSLTNGQTATTTVTITPRASLKAEVGAGVSVVFSTTPPAGYTITGAVTTQGTVTVTFTNSSGGTVDLAQGTLTVYVSWYWQQQQFNPAPSINLIGQGKPILRATSGFTNGADLVTYKYNGVANDAPWNSKIEGIVFNGEGRALAGVRTRFQLSLFIDRCFFYNMRAADGIGIAFADTNANDGGYGAHRVTRSKFWNQTCILVRQAGDTIIDACDFWPQPDSGGTAFGIDLKKLGGQTKVSNNVFNRDSSVGSLYGVRLDGNNGTSNGQHIRDVRIINNEFAGHNTAILSSDTGAGLQKKVGKLIIAYNHVIANGVPTANVVQTMCELRDTTDTIISNNFFNSLFEGSGTGYAAATDYAMKMYRCERVTITDNQFAATNGGVAYFQSCKQFLINDNQLNDVGLTSTGHLIFELDTAGGVGCTDFMIVNNYVEQTSGSYSQNFVFERSNAARNYVKDNKLKGIAASSAYTRAGADSIFNGAELRGSATYNPPNLVDGAGDTTTVTVTGARVGDSVSHITFSNDLQGINAHGWVSAADTVSVRFQNETGGTLDLASGTLTVRVTPIY